MELFCVVLKVVDDIIFDLKIITINVGGLIDFDKRRQMYRVLKEKGADVVLMQESHSYGDSDNMCKN